MICDLDPFFGSVFQGSLLVSVGQLSVCCENFSDLS